MNDATRWRTSLGRTVAQAYIQDKNVAAVALGGSVGRGWADAHSDIELFVFWQEPPSNDARSAAVARAGGTIDILWTSPPADTEYHALIERADGCVGQLWPYEDDEWSEHFYVNCVNIGVSGFLVATIDRYLIDLIERYDPAEGKQIIVAAVQHGVPIYGLELVQHWQAQASSYPVGLAQAVIVEQLELDEQWSAVDMLAERDERLILYTLFARMTQRIVRILLALNGMYLPDPRLKWLDRLVAQMEIKPVQLDLQLKQVFQLEPKTVVVVLQQLFDETLALVVAHVPSIDVHYAHVWSRIRRAYWPNDPRLAR